MILYCLIIRLSVTYAMMIVPIIRSIRLDLIMFTVLYVISLLSIVSIVLMLGLHAQDVGVTLLFIPAMYHASALNKAVFMNQHYSNTNNPSTDADHAIHSAELAMRGAKMIVIVVQMSAH